jgi:hypothetical protein
MRNAACPKGQGQGIMLSVFQSREFGFLMELSEKALAKVNAFCQENSNTDEAAAKYLLGMPKKQPLKSTPFYCEL